MARRGRPPVKVALDDPVRAELKRVARAATTEQRLALRARIILACEERGSAEAVARATGVHPSTVEKWRGRFLTKGIAGLADMYRNPSTSGVGRPLTLADRRWSGGA